METAQNEKIAFSTQPKTLAEERVYALYQGMPLSILLTIVLVLLLSISHWNIINHSDLILWNMAMMFVMLLRTLTWFLWRNAEVNLSTNTWLLYFRLEVILAGIAWGSASYFMFASLNTAYQALLAFTLAGVASASLTSLAIDKISAVGFVTIAIVPLSIRLHGEHGPTATAMSIMVALFIVFVLSATSRARKQLEKDIAQNTRLIEWGNERLTQQQMSKLISRAQALFIAENDNNTTFEQLLADTVTINASQFGFIAETLCDNNQTPYLKMLAMSNIAWSKDSEAAYRHHKTQGMTFTNLHTLFGVALTTGKPIISNTPATDMRAAGTPHGHPTLTAFIGIPIFNNAQQVAMLGLANKKGGYSDADIESLTPITQLIAQFMIAINHRRQHLLDQQNIQQHAKHTQAILDGVFDGIITLNEQGDITSFNHAAEVIFGYRAEHIINHNILQLMPAQHKDATSEKKPSEKKLSERSPSEFLRNGLGKDQELTGLRKSGKEFEMEIALSSIETETATAYIGVIRDISDRKITEKLKNEFIATISHELRTPLTSISASLAIIESGTLGALPDKISGLLHIAKNNSLRLQHLINDLLDMDKLLSNNIEFNLTAFDALKLVEDTINDNQYIANKYHVKFHIISAEPNCTLWADKARTQQVLTHLLSNAAKFSNAHSMVDISIANSKDFINITVTDHGIGISPEFQANIFSRFSQEDSSSSRSKEGSGIGLSISKELIDKMNGEIGFTSTLGQGSRFYFKLPKANSSIQHSELV